MADMVLNTELLQKTLRQLIQTEKVRLYEKNGEIRIIPIMDTSSADNSIAAKHISVRAEDKINRLNALKGSGFDLKMTVDSFIAQTHDKTEMSL
jgi:hypothetical protein